MAEIYVQADLAYRSFRGEGDLPANHERLNSLDVLEKGGMELTGNSSPKEGFLKLTPPPDWVRAPLSYSGEPRSSLEAYCAPANADVTLNFYDRGHELGPAGKKSFQDILERKGGSEKAQPLLPSEVAALSEVFGINSVGDNQFSNGNKAGGAAGPVFHLDMAYAQKVQGHRSVFVEGRFVDENGAPQREFVGAYIEGANGAGSRVQEVYLEGSFSDRAKPDGFLSHRSTFKKTLEEGR